MSTPICLNRLEHRWPRREAICDTCTMLQPPCLADVRRQFFNLRQELSRLAHLLFFYLDLGRNNGVTEDYSLRMKLNPTPLVRLRIVDGDELLTMLNNFSQTDGLPVHDWMSPFCVEVK